MSKMVQPFIKAQSSYIKAQNNGATTLTFNQYKDDYINDMQQQLGGYAIWGETTSKEPRAEHLKFVGKRFDVTKGLYDSVVKKYVIPGQLYNCKCKMLPIGDSNTIKASALTPDIIQESTSTNNGIANIAGTQFLTTQTSFDNSNQLTKEGYNQFSDALKMGGGSLSSQKNTATYLYLNGTEIVKFIIKKEENGYVYVEITGKDTKKNEKFDNIYKINEKKYNIYTMQDNYFMRYNDFKNLIIDFEKNNLIITTFGGVIVNE